MTVIKSKRMWRENFERKNLKHKDTTWMIAESLELTMSLTSFQEEMKKRWNWGKDSPQTGGRQGARTVESLWKQQRDQGESRRVRTARHPERRGCGTRCFSSFGIIPHSCVCAKSRRCPFPGLWLLFQTEILLFHLKIIRRCRISERVHYPQPVFARAAILVHLAGAKCWMTNWKVEPAIIFLPGKK